jgi:hypothetical protein
MSRLADELSPYLRRHRHDPVDWYPWGEDARRRARDDDKPILLCVGYSTCYWCEVMGRESFADPEVAAFLNERFVNVLVDREERPDVDEIYMAATQLLTHQGGWPNTVVLTPQLAPWFCGTYFPPEDRGEQPGFRRVAASMAEAWKTRRGEAQEQAAELLAVMRRYLEDRGEPATAPPAAAVAERALASLASQFDAEWGGFGTDAKFPMPANLFLLEDFSDDDGARRMLGHTLERMARGGLHDQLGGGFHRHATDRAWKVPHFEKLLADNGLLLELYARQHERTGDPEAARVTRETAAFLDREMGTEDGGFAGAVAAEGHAWTLAELVAALGEEDAGFLAPILGFDGPPFFEGTRYVLHLPLPLAEQARRRRTTYEGLLAEIEPLRAKLLAARRTARVDDKVLTDWNGMAIAGLAEAGRVLGDDAIVARAVHAADFVLGRLRPADGPLRHAWRAGVARWDAFLADYVYLVRGLLALHRATGDERWLAASRELTREQVERLGDERGGFYAAAEAPDLVCRSKPVFDGAVPSGNAVAVLNLLELAKRDGDGRWRELAAASLKAFAGAAERGEGVRALCLAARCFDGRG